MACECPFGADAGARQPRVDRNLCEGGPGAFGIGPTFVREVNESIPANWTMPGRQDGVTRNSVAMGSLFGSSVSSTQSQANVAPVGRLG